MRRRRAGLLDVDHPRPTMSAVWDLVGVTVFVWVSVLVVHGLDVSQALADWNRSHAQWAVDEVTLISVLVMAALGVFSWRRWQESLRVIARHEATLRRLRTTEHEVALKDQLINAVSHELRTPLTVLLGYAELLGGEVEADERQAMLDRVVAQGWELEHTVEDLLTRAQADLHTLTLATVPVLLYGQAAQVVEGLGPEERARVRLAREGSVRALGDPARVRQIIRNLVSNALRHGGPQISILIGAQSGTTYLEVIDNGPGVPDGDRELIFSPYYRVSNARQAPPGIGLGLAISRELARLMAGDLAYLRRRGRTLFRLSLPAAEALDPAGGVGPPPWDGSLPGSADHRCGEGSRGPK